ncbi:hypothetical protein LINPERHAP1_LOCUS7136 [Linum perenne]
MKLEALNENLNLIAFKPAKDLDFASHEEVLKRLGLWDFVNLKFDSNLRTDLVSQLIASYDPQLRASYVNEARVKVNRADLARALKLPAKKDKVSASEGETEVKESEEAIAFVDELVSTWMLLHDDTWMMPADIHNMTRTIKEGSFERFDWAGLIWSMVEKELSAAPNLEGVDVEEVEGEGVDVDEVEGEGVDVQEVEEMDFDRSPKEDDTLDGVDSENLLESMEVGQGALSSEMQLHANLSSGDFLASRVDIDTNNHGSTSLYGNGNDHKRGIGQLDDEGDIPHHAFHKRIRSDEQQPYEEGKAPLESEVCFDQLQFWLDKARVSQMEKEKGIQEANENQQLLHNELQARAEMIQHLQNVRYAEDQKRRMEIYKLERELYMMGNLLEGYRKALKETHKSFADYRLKRPFPEEPLYKDTGIGGLVLTATEVEKLRKEEEERLNRLEIENKLKEFELEWAGKFQAHEEKIESLGGRLLDTEKNVNLLKEMQVKRSTSSPIAECPPTEQ